MPAPDVRPDPHAPGVGEDERAMTLQEEIKANRLPGLPARLRQAAEEQRLHYNRIFSSTVGYNHLTEAAAAIEELLTALREERARTVEACAKMAEEASGWRPHGDRIAAAIRSLNPENDRAG